MIDGLLTLADALVSDIPERTQAELRRGVSTAYYALFHAIAHAAADLFAGAAKRDDDAWERVYRALDHGLAVRACQQIKDKNFGTGITGCSSRFAQLQHARHAADYDPVFSLTVEQARLLVDTARVAIGQLRGADLDERQRFAIHLLFKKR